MRGEQPPPLAADPERFGKTKGRQIDLPSNKERFQSLEPNLDYTLIDKNTAIAANRPLSDFFVFIDPSGGNIEHIIEPPHWRTVTDKDIVAHTRIRENKGDKFVDKNIPFYVANTKGVGFLKPTAEGISLDEYKSWTKKDPEGEHDFGHQMLGLSSKDDYGGKDIMTKSQYLISQGLRTEVYWGIAKLQNVFYHGKRTSIDELREQGVILKRREYQPHMAVRLMKTNTRIAEAAESDERRDAIFTEAFDTFNKEVADQKLNFPELDIKNKDHQKIFFKEFFRRMGENMAILLNIGHSHFRMHSANVTMAAEIVDIGTLGGWRSEEKDQDLSKKYNGVRKTNIKDMRDMAYGFKELLKAAKLANLSTDTKENLAQAAMDGFKNKLDEKYLRSMQKTDPIGALQWFQKIISAVIIEGKRLAPLQHNQIEDWPI